MSRRSWGPAATFVVRRWRAPSAVCRVVAGCDAGRPRRRRPPPTAVRDDLRKRPTTRTKALVDEVVAELDALGIAVQRGQRRPPGPAIGPWPTAVRDPHRGAPRGAGPTEGFHAATARQIRGNARGGGASGAPRELAAQRELAHWPGRPRAGAGAGVREHVRRRSPGSWHRRRGADDAGRRTPDDSRGRARRGLRVRRARGADVGSGQPQVFAEVVDAFAIHRAWRDQLRRGAWTRGPSRRRPSRATSCRRRPDPGRGDAGLRWTSSPLCRDVRLRRREDRGPGPPLGRRRAHAVGRAAGGVRRIAGAVPRSLEDLG